MDAKKLVMLGLVAGGGYVAYSLYKSEQASAATDQYGNPPGTCYDAEGRGIPCPPERATIPPALADIETPVPGGQLPEGGFTGTIFWEWSLEQWQDSYTVPAGQVGGLRVAANSMLLDGRVLPYGTLAWPLAAHDTIISVADNPAGWPPIVDGRAAAVALNEMGRWYHLFRPGIIYRLLIEEEPIVAQCLGKISARPGTTFQIIDRPMMENWRNPRAEAFRLFDSDDQRGRWPLYTGPNPIYHQVRPRYTDDEGRTHPGGEAVWVNERRYNCQHASNSAASGYPYLEYEPRTDSCRPMTAEERASYDEYHAAIDAAEEAEAVGSFGERSAQCRRLWGLSCGDAEEWNYYEGQSDSPPSADEIGARNAALSTRVRLTQVADLEEYAPQYAPGSPRASVLPVAADTMEVRRRRGRDRYSGFDPIKRREIQRDWFAFHRGQIDQGGGEPGAVAVGGPHGFAAIWIPPGQQVYERVGAARTVHMPAETMIWRGGSS